MLAIAQKAEAANPDNPHLHGMLAFGYEQMHELAEAEREARLALEIKAQGAVGAARARPRHALDRPRAEGVAFLDEAQQHLDRPQQLHVHPQLVA